MTEEINGQTITTKKARPRLGHSAQAKWARKMQKAGRCRACGKPRPLELKQHCRDCQDKINGYMKAYRKAKKEKASDPTKPTEATTNSNSEPTSN